MANPRAFISFDFDHDADQRTLFAGQSRNSRTPFTVQDWSSKAALPQGQWEAIIEDKINRCHLMIVLVSPYTASATGVAKELRMAQRRDVPYFGVFVKGANSSSRLPTGLTLGQMVHWDWAQVASAIDRMMRQGKNRW